MRRSQIRAGRALCLLLVVALGASGCVERALQMPQLDFGGDSLSDLSTVDALSPLCPAGEGSVLLNDQVFLSTHSIVPYGEDLIVPGSAGQLLRVPRRGGPAAVLAPVDVTQVTREGTLLYMVVFPTTCTANDCIYLARLDLASGNQLTKLADVGPVGAIVALGGAAYWLGLERAGTILRRWQNGIVTDLGPVCATAGALAVVGDEVWMVAGSNCSSVRAYRPSDGREREVVNLPEQVTAIVADAREAWLALSPQGPGTLDFKVIDLASGALREVSSGGPYAFQLAIDAQSLYWVEHNSDPNLSSVGRSDGQLRSLATGDSLMNAVAADGECVYFLTAATPPPNYPPQRLYRVPARR